jgi:phospholipid/cholesterol/gamma-HCH transport system permease protein
LATGARKADGLLRAEQPHEAQNVAAPERSSPALPAPFALSRDTHAGLGLSGRLTLADASALWKQLQGHVAEIPSGGSLNFDMSRVETIDGGALALLVHARSDMRLRSVECEFVNASPRIQDLVHLYRGDVDPKPRRKRRPDSALAQIGHATVAFGVEVKAVFGFLGSVVLAALGLLREPRTANWKAVMPIMERTGTDAVPIVVLINFLVGFVMAFQGAIQLKQFGANIFVADLVDLSVVRELGPLMTAIIVCGRSGAAFAAYLVLPRAFALMLVMPILTLFADLIGMLGGLTVGLLSLDLTISGYLIESRKALTFWDIGSGLLKSVVFAMAIAVISCQQGFATTGGAEGVGRRTTSSVVSILFSLILIDAAFTVFFYSFHL